ncbi:MAG TPA: hypothetical protein EYP04_12100, partial [Anaerolineae bacterium]|nr:hypothetical protein [Anaerolineae bacterium]
MPNRLSSHLLGEKPHAKIVPGGGEVVERRLWRHFDWALLCAVLLLIGLGVAMIHSATINTPGLEDYDRRQMVFALMGLIVMLAVGAFDYRHLGVLVRPIYLLLLMMLLAVAMAGQVMGGAQRWIDLGFFPIQPSELSKVFVILVLSKFLGDHSEEIGRLR